MECDIAGRVVVVTGGTKGVGRAVVAKLARGGACVVFQGRDEAAADSLIGELSGVEVPPVFVAADLYEYDDVARVVRTAVDTFGRLDGAVGSGMSGSGAGFRPFREIEPDFFLEYYKSGALARLFLLRAAAEVMAPRKYGKVVLVTTDAGRVPTPGESMIGAAAASLVFVARAAGRELTRDGIRVNTVAISLTRDTPGYDRFAAKRDAGGPADLHVKAFQKLEQRMPFGLATAAEVADLVMYLIAPESDGVTGATFSVNRGGYFPAYA